MLENWSHIFDTNKLEMDLRKNMPSILINPKNQKKVSVINENNYYMHTKACQKMLQSCIFQSPST